MSVHRNMIGEIRVQRSSAQTVTEKVSFEVSPDRSRPKPSQLAGAMAAADAPGCESRATPFLYDSSAITKPSSPLPTIAQPVDGRPFIAATHDRACTGQRGSQGPSHMIVHARGREAARGRSAGGDGKEAERQRAVAAGSRHGEVRQWGAGCRGQQKLSASACNGVRRPASPMTHLRSDSNTPVTTLAPIARQVSSRP